MNPFTRNYIPFADTKGFEKLITDYLSDDEFLKQFYSFEDSLEGLKQAINGYKNPRLNRENLQKIITKQYKDFGINKLPLLLDHNIELLKNANTFTITAGHQLNVLGGPLYVIYKLISAINLAESLNKLIPSCRFVPVYWMASEDHDIEEITSINLFGKNFKWETKWKGVSGKMPMDGFDNFFSELKESFRETPHSKELFDLISNSYQQSSTLAEATRKWIHLLLGQYGLIILDPNEASFKKSISDIIIEEAINQTSSSLINDSISALEKKYHSQAKPREINLFYLGENYRSRLVNENNSLRVLNTELTFSKEKIREEIQNHPEKFSPNVVLRPLYQESILPNIAFIGGPAEIAYWLELKKLFEFHHVPMPALFHRCSALILDRNSSKKFEKFSIRKKDIFLSSDDLIKAYIQNMNGESPSLDKTIAIISGEFTTLSNTVSLIDPTLRPAVESENQRMIASLRNLEDKIVRSLKKKNETEVNQIRKVKEKLFPAGKLQERVESFISCYLNWGSSFLVALKEELDPLIKEFNILEEKDN